MQVAVLWAMQNGYFDDVSVASVKDFQSKLQDYFATRKEVILSAIREKGAIDDGITADLKSDLSEFKQGYQA
jgi:F-type H+-transporting ATPase subunit alpha